MTDKTGLMLDGPRAGDLIASRVPWLEFAEYDPEAYDGFLNHPEEPLHIRRYSARHAYVYLAGPRTVSGADFLPHPEVATGNVWYINQIALDHAVCTLKAMHLMMRWLG